ncbi:MAG: alkaline phosphatase family protein [Acidimicrobiales bacterium]
MLRPASPRGPRLSRATLGVLIAAGLLVVSSASGASTVASKKQVPVERVPGGPTGGHIVPAGIHKIKHFLIIEQENRSFDNYFGTSRAMPT